MRLTETDVENIHKLEKFLKEAPRAIGEMAKYLGVSVTLTIDYLEVFLKNPKVYKMRCTDLAGPEKKWVME